MGRKGEAWHGTNAADADEHRLRQRRERYRRKAELKRAARDAEKQPKGRHKVK